MLGYVDPPRPDVTDTSSPTMSPLILKHASANRPSGEWRDDDYDLLENGFVVGRIVFLDAVGRQGRPLDGRAGTRATCAERRMATSRRWGPRYD